MKSILNSTILFYIKYISFIFCILLLTINPNTLYLKRGIFSNLFKAKINKDNYEIYMENFTKLKLKCRNFPSCINVAIGLANEENLLSIIKEIYTNVFIHFRSNKNLIYSNTKYKEDFEKFYNEDMNLSLDEFKTDNHLSKYLNKSKNYKAAFYIYSSTLKVNNILIRDIIDWSHKSDSFIDTVLIFNQAYNKLPDKFNEFKILNKKLNIICKLLYEKLYKYSAYTLDKIKIYAFIDVEHYYNVLLNNMDKSNHYFLSFTPIIFSKNKYQNYDISLYNSNIINNNRVELVINNKYNSQICLGKKLNSRFFTSNPYNKEFILKPFSLLDIVKIKKSNRLISIELKCSQDLLKIIAKKKYDSSKIITL